LKKINLPSFFFFYLFIWVAEDQISNS